jgi:hypothetical protein
VASAIDARRTIAVSVISATSRFRLFCRFPER